MGIDIYMTPNMVYEDGVGHSDEAPAFSINSGHQGYLREAYHGGPYVTDVLVPEAFAEDIPHEGAPIPAATMRERLPAARAAYIERIANVYPNTPADEIEEVWQQSFVAFVELAERIEAANDGEAVQVYASY